MPADDEREPGKTGADSGSGPVAGTANVAPGDKEPQAAREPRASRDTREARDRLPLAELLKRGLSAGQAVSESFLPRDLASNIASQLVDARHGLVKAIASEVGRFLRQADIASEMRKVLAGLQVEAKIQLRFSEDEQGKLRSEMKVEDLDSKADDTRDPPSSS